MTSLPTPVELTQRTKWMYITARVLPRSEQSIIWREMSTDTHSVTSAKPIQQYKSVCSLSDALRELLQAFVHCQLLYWPTLYIG